MESFLKVCPNRKDCGERSLEEKKSQIVELY